MAKEIEILKDITGPNGKPWAQGLIINVSDQIASYLIGEGSARLASERQKEFQEKLAKLVAEGKVKTADKTTAPKKGPTKD